MHQFRALPTDPMSLFAFQRELLACALLGILLHLLLRTLLRRPGRRLPPGPRGWPVLGAFPLLGRAPHVTLAKLAKTYGPVMHLWMGQNGVVVASSPDAVRTFVTAYDLNFSNRPLDAGPTHIGYRGQGIVFADYGPRWKLLRRLSSVHMLGTGALERWADVRRTEMGCMLRAMRESSQRGEPVALVKMLVCAMANMIGSVVLSKRVFESAGEESSEFKKMVDENMTLSGLVNVGDFVPAVAWMDLQGIERRMKNLHKRLDALLTKMVEEHARAAEERKGNPDLLDVVTSHEEEADGVRLTDVNIKALLLVYEVLKHSTNLCF